MGALLNDGSGIVRDAALEALVIFARQGKQQEVMEIVFDQSDHERIPDDDDWDRFSEHISEYYWYRDNFDDNWASWQRMRADPDWVTALPGWSTTPMNARMVALKAVASSCSDLDIRNITKLAANQRVEVRLHAISALRALVPRNAIIKQKVSRTFVMFSSLPPQPAPPT